MSKIVSALGLKKEISSWFCSILFHFFFLLILLYFVSQTPQPGNVLGERNTNAVGIVFSTSDGYETPKEIAKVNHSSSSAKSSSRSTIDKILSETENDNNLRNELFSPQRIGMTSSGSSDHSLKNDLLSGLGSSTGNAQNGSGGQSVGFADLKGTGRRFVYVLDRSDSMKWNSERPMRYAVEEAQKSIQSLDPQKGALKFQLVYYNHEAEIFQNSRLLDVNESNKRKMIRFLQSIFPTGGTNSLNAIEKAVSLKPDVIFFLTDADEEIGTATLAQIRSMRIRNDIAQIHVVEFGRQNRRKNSSFRQLADENNGMYIFKNIDDL